MSELIGTMGLNGRQLAVLKKLALCETVKSIGLDLSISPKTVEHHIAALYQKTNCKSHEELIRFAYEHGLVSKGERTTDIARTIIVPPEIEIRKANDLADALIKTAQDAANGRADVLQVNALCQTTNTLINFARLQMDVLEKAGGRLPNWLIAGSIDVEKKPKS